MYLRIYTKLSNFFTFDHWSSTEHNSILGLDLKDIRGKEAFLMPRQLFSQDMDILWTNFLNHFSSICVLCTMHNEKVHYWWGATIILPFGKTLYCKYLPQKNNQLKFIKSAMMNLNLPQLSNLHLCLSPK